MSMANLWAPEKQKFILNKYYIFGGIKMNTKSGIMFDTDCDCFFHLHKECLDVVAVAWLLNDDDRFMLSRTIKTQLPTYDLNYEEKPIEKFMQYVYFVKRDALIEDMFKKLKDNKKWWGLKWI